MEAATPQDNAWHMEKMYRMLQIGYFRGVCRKRRARAMNEVVQETAQDSAEESSIDLANINSIHFNKNCLVITAKLKTSAGINNVIVP